LPQPVGPTTALNVPAPIVMSTSRRAVNVDPAGVANRFVTPLSSIGAARLVTVLTTVILLGWPDPAPLNSRRRHQGKMPENPSQYLLWLR